MLRALARRIAIAIPLLFVITAVVLALQSALPGNPAEAILGPDATPAQYAAESVKLHLSDPFIVRYWDWVSQALQGNLGSSWFTGQSVAAMVWQRLPVTLSLVIGALVVAGVIGTLLGVASAVGGRLGRGFVDVISLLGLALPAFWVGLVLIAVFAVSLRVLPATGFVPFTQSPSGWFKSLVLPVTAFGLIGISMIAKTVRDGMLRALAADYVRTLRAAGVPERSVIWRHALKNAALPAVTMLGVIFTTSLAGTVLIESVFGLPGLGAALAQATTTEDFPVLEGLAVVMTVMIVIVNLLVDLLYSLLNPKVRVA